LRQFSELAKGTELEAQVRTAVQSITSGGEGNPMHRLTISPSSLSIANLSELGHPYRRAARNGNRYTVSWFKGKLRHRAWADINFAARVFVLPSEGGVKVDAQASRGEIVPLILAATESGLPMRVWARRGSWAEYQKFSVNDGFTKR